VSAVRYLHERGLSHGDIKPENVVFDARGNAKLIDFAYRKDRIGPEEDKTGTLHSPAPEMLASALTTLRWRACGHSGFCCS
jgi:serine/threonine protein kinase